MSLFLINGILLLLALFLLLVLSMVWPPNSPWAPWWRTNEKKSQAIIDLAKITEKDIVYELGSGDGEFLMLCAQKGARCVGIEIDPLRVWVSKIRIKLAGLDNKITIIQKDFFKVDISAATVVYLYLVPNALKKLKPKFKKELKKGTRVVSLIYKIEGMEKITEDKENKLYLYKIS